MLIPKREEKGRKEDFDDECLEGGRTRREGDVRPSEGSEWLRFESGRVMVSKKNILSIGSDQGPDQEGLG